MLCVRTITLLSGIIAAAIAQTRKKGVMLTNRAGLSSSELGVARADGRDKRMLTDSVWEEAMLLCTPAKVS